MTEDERARIAKSVADLAETFERVGRLFREAEEAALPALRQLRDALAQPEVREALGEDGATVLPGCPVSRDGRHMYHRVAVHGDETCLRCGQSRGVSITLGRHT